MNTKPFAHALAAAAYIGALASFFFYGKSLWPAEDSVIMPITMLSLLVFSVAMMGYFFAYQPLRFLFEGKQKEAVAFFFATVASFFGITAVIVLGWFLFFA